MKTKILSVLFVVIICAVLVVACIPVGASDVDVNPSGDEVFQPISVEFVVDSTGDRIVLNTSPRLQVGYSTENYVYGETNYLLGAYSSAGDWNVSYYITDDVGDDIDVYDCIVTFPDFYFYTSTSGPPASNAFIMLPDALDYISWRWTYDVVYYDREDGEKHVLSFYDDSGDLMSPESIPIPILEIYNNRVLNYDYVNIQNLRCHITTTDGNSDLVNVGTSRGQFVAIGSVFPDSINMEVIELTPNLFDWIIRPLDEFLNIQIVPPDPSGDFGGATIGGILALVIAIPLLVAFLKVFAGG